MKIKVNQPFLNYRGKEVKTSDGENFTIRDLIDRVLNLGLPNEILTAEQKTKTHRMNLSLYASNEVEFTVKDSGYILDRAGKSSHITPEMYGRLEEIFESREDSEPAEKGSKK